MFRRGLPLLLLAATLVACSGGGSSPSTHPTPTASVTATATPPSEELAALAGKGASASFSATYRFHQAKPDTTATVRVWRAGPSLRVDVVSGARTATLLHTPSGSYSCSITGRKRSCLLIAKAGRAIPKPFDVAPANLFTADLASLALSTASYDVRSAPDLPASGAVPAARCFDVAPATSAPMPPMPAGRYCFVPSGLLAAATYPSGNTVQLTSATVAPPAAGVFKPYAKPSPLPGG